MKKIVVAMSGGIDSSVAVKLLQEQGFKVIGLTGKMTCSSEAVCQKAKDVAEQLNIEHHIVDATELFKDKVINYYKDSYQKGETPNPCIMCNQFIKWGVLFDYAINKLGADLFATGHYANIKNIDGIFKLYPASDEHKDQLYFLHKLEQKHLSKTIFPLSKYTKTEIKELALKYNLPLKDSKESQDICFIEKPLTTKKYLMSELGIKKGDFIEVGTGKKLGEHDGHYFYTIGQRKGIGISAPRPLYVIDLDAEQNIVYLGYEEDNYKTRLAIKDITYTYPFNKTEFEAMVKIRYNMDFKKAKCKIIDDLIEVEFIEPLSSVTSGQFGVLYDINDRHMIGGGTII